MIKGILIALVLALLSGFIGAFIGILLHTFDAVEKRCK